MFLTTEVIKKRAFYRVMKLMIVALLSILLSPIVVGLITKTLRTIYVEREDPNSRMKAAEEIRRRTHTRGEWPKVLVFPEGE